MSEPLLLVLNAGSSSLKFEVFSATGRHAAGVTGGAVRDIGRPSATFERDGRTEALPGHVDMRAAADIVLARLFSGAAEDALDEARLIASGHRVVHGGDRFHAPLRITVSAFDALKSLGPLAPLHNPPALTVMEVVGERFPDLPIVAVFDTAFFHSLPEEAARYAIPSDWVAAHPIRRYGFHGIAHRHLAAVLAGAGAGPRAVTLHLGQGCSAAALLDGRPLDTSMGFTPLEGLVMGTRSGDVDPGVLLYLARCGYDWSEIEDGLNRRGGLRALSGLSDDVRDLLAAEQEGHTGARLALDVFCARIRKYIGAYAAVLGGLDAIAFGGGIGENSPALRERVLQPFAWLDVELDRAANEKAVGMQNVISTGASAVKVLVVPVDEESTIAEAALDVLAGSGG